MFNILHMKAELLTQKQILKRGTIKRVESEAYSIFEPCKLIFWFGTGILHFLHSGIFC